MYIICLYVILIATYSFGATGSQQCETVWNCRLTQLCKPNSRFPGCRVPGLLLLGIWFILVLILAIV